MFGENNIFSIYKFNALKYNEFNTKQERGFS